MEKKDFKIHVKKLSSLPCNKICCECSQPGPMYANVTIGAFICNSCSGVIRGLNPPHRVKNISISSFTKQEYELLATMGNANINALYMSKAPANLLHINIMSTAGERLLFLNKKYEKKIWMIDQQNGQHVKKHGMEGPNLPDSNINISAQAKTTAPNEVGWQADLAQHYSEQNSLGDINLNSSTSKSIIQNLPKNQTSELQDIFGNFTIAETTGQNSLVTNIFPTNMGSGQLNSSASSWVSNNQAMELNSMFNNTPQPYYTQHIENQFQPRPNTNYFGAAQQFSPYSNSQIIVQNNTAGFGLDSINYHNFPSELPQSNPPYFRTAQMESNNIANSGSNLTSPPEGNSFSWLQNVPLFKNNMKSNIHQNDSTHNLIEMSQSSSIINNTSEPNQNYKKYPNNKPVENDNFYSDQNSRANQNFELSYRRMF